jgi:hypothetical protein
MFGQIRVAPKKTTRSEKTSNFLKDSNMTAVMIVLGGISGGVKRVLDAPQLRLPFCRLRSEGSSGFRGTGTGISGRTELVKMAGWFLRQMPLRKAYSSFLAFATALKG